MHSSRPRGRLGRWVIGLAFIALGSAPLGCSGAALTQSGSGPAVADTGAAKQLEGNWMLETFQPSVPFEPAMDAFISAQFGRLVISFDGKSVRSESGGIWFERPYTVRSNLFSRVELQVLDQGMTYDFVGIIDGNHLRFDSLTEPWQGKGSLLRQP